MTGAHALRHEEPRAVRHQAKPPRASRRARIVAGIVFGFAGLATATAITLGLLLATGSSAVTPLVATPPDAQAILVAEDAAAEQAVESDNDGVVPDPIAGQPLRIQIPAVGLDAEVRAMTVPADGALDPPGPYRAYWVADYGIAGPASTNTTYIAAHSWRDGSAAFNPLMDMAQSGAAVHAGDQVIITTPEGDVSYTIDSTTLYDKATVEQQQILWEQVPGRLVLVTCFQYNGITQITQNFVVFAHLNS